MAMPYVISNLFSLGGNGRGLGRHERINTDNDQHDDEETGSVTVSTTADPSSSATRSSPDIEEGRASSSSSQPAATEDAANSNAAETSDTETSRNNSTEQSVEDLTFQNEEEEENNSLHESTNDDTDNNNTDLNRRMAQLEEERELRRRRQSTCTIVVIFILFRLWVEALAEGDVGLLFICMVGTSWTAKWIRARREQEEEIDRRMEEYFRRAQRGEEGGSVRSSAEAELSLMSFQAQLALAILESQRQMMENGGFGPPDGENQQNRGVSEEARSRWSRYEYAPSEIESGGKVRKDGYGSVLSGEGNDPGHEVPANESSGGGNTTSSSSTGSSIPKKLVDSENLDDYEMPSCSICLCEYEQGESLTRLPCGHVYHEECVTAWVTNHIRCPLCNYDLEEDFAASSSSSVTSTTTSSENTSSNVRILSHSDSIV